MLENIKNLKNINNNLDVEILLNKSTLELKSLRTFLITFDNFIKDIKNIYSDCFYFNEELEFLIKNTTWIEDIKKGNKDKKMLVYDEKPYKVLIKTINMIILNRERKKRKLEYNEYYV